MTGRERLHHLVEELPESDLAAAGRMLCALGLPADPEGTER